MQQSASVSELIVSAHCMEGGDVAEADVCVKAQIMFWCLVLSFLSHARSLFELLDVPAVSPFFHLSLGGIAVDVAQREAVRPVRKRRRTDMIRSTANLASETWLEESYFHF